MKKTVLGLVTVAAGVLLTTPVFAADTEGNIQYIEGDVTINPGPVDPDTGGPVDPGTGTPETPQPGGNYASWVPNNLNFGYHPIESKTAQSWTARNVDTTGTTDVEELATRYDGAALTVGSLGIEDNRGTAEGWDITVKQVAEFTLGTDTTRKLNNTTLTIATGAITTNITGGATTGVTGPSGNNLVLTPTNTETSIFTAPVGTGEGVTRLALNSFTLAIPAGQNQSEGLYQADVVWTIGDVPQP